jgi:hypothetical protein
MATQADVRRIALSLPQTEEAVDRFAFSVRNKGKLKGFVWVWMERIEPKKPRAPQPDVIAVRVASLAEKDRILALDPSMHRGARRSHADCVRRLILRGTSPTVNRTAQMALSGAFWRFLGRLRRRSLIS